MNTPHDDGGPAFPCQPRDGQGYPCGEMMPGMSLRDWFAGMALQGQVSMPEIHAGISNEVYTVADVAASTYEWADAMLAARKEEP